MLLNEVTLGPLVPVSPGGRTPIQVYVLDEFSINANALMVVMLTGYERFCRRPPDLLWSFWTPHDI